MSHPGHGAEREPTFEEKEGLVRAFLRLQGMQEQSTRMLYVRQLAESFPSVLSAPRHGDAWHDVWSLLDACYQLQGAVQRLVQIVCAFHPESQWLGHLHLMVDSLFPPPLLNDQERERLVELLGRADVSVLAASYRYADRTVYHKLAPDLTDVDATVRRLEAYVGQPGRLPAVFDFADHAAHQTGRRLEGEIHRWIDEVAVRLGFHSRGDVDAMCEATRRRLTLLRRYYFVVQLTPDKITQDRYLLSAWLQQDHSPEAPIRCDDDAVALTEAVERLYDLLQQVPEHIDDVVEELWIELILPRALITRPVDQWPVDREFPHVLGTAHPLVIRSLDRLRCAPLHPPWAKKWRWMTTNGRNPDLSYFLDIDEHDRRPDVGALRAKLLRNDSPVALVMRTPPQESDCLGADDFAAGIRGGAPIMIWCRDSSLAEQFQEQIRIRFAAGDLFGLPQRVFELRLLAAESAEQMDKHVGSHVTLLWDDFDRIPEGFRHRARVRAPQPGAGDTS